MNQQCKVCGEPAAGFHFGAFTCEGCKSFFGRSYNNLGTITECKNNGECVINKKNRTSCKACRLRKCLVVGMSKSGSRYGRRSNWFKIHCLLQEQQQVAMASFGAKSPNEHSFPLSYPPTFLQHDPPSSISSPDSVSSETSPPTFLPVPFSSMLMGTSPFLLHPNLFPFPSLRPAPCLPHSDEETPTKPPASPILNNNYDSKNHNLERMPKRFNLDAILGLQREEAPKKEREEEEAVQENPIDLSVRSKSPEDSKLEVKKALTREELKLLPLDLTV